MQLWRWGHLLRSRRDAHRTALFFVCVEEGRIGGEKKSASIAKKNKPHFYFFLFDERRNEEREPLSFLSMSSRYLALARALRAASGASASCSSAGICGGGGGARESIRILCSSGSMTMATMKPSSSSSSSSIWSRELTVSAASQRYLPPVRTGGPSMVDKGTI